MPKQLNIACWVTLSRPLLLPAALLPVLLQWQNGWLLAAFTCAIAGFTDLLDGHLARQKKCVTPLGSLLDPLADKLFVSVMLILLVSHNVIPFWVLGIVVPREITISLMRLQRFRAGLAIDPDLWGKAKTAAFMVAIIGLLLRQDLLEGGVLAEVNIWIPIGLTLYLAWWSMLIAIGLTLFSGANYFVSYAGLARGTKKPLLQKVARRPHRTIKEAQGL